MTYSAVVLGGTGLIGSHLINHLIGDIYCVEVRLITRRKTNFKHPKIKEIIINFSKDDDYRSHIKGDVLFLTLGTTRKQANGKEMQYLVDYSYQYKAAFYGFQNQIKHYVLISSPWSNIESKNYYRKMKAELERDTIALGFEKTIILKPNGLMGTREKPRFGEKYGFKLFNFLIKIIPSLIKHKPIEAETVARIMVETFHKAQSNSKKVIILERNEIQ